MKTTFKPLLAALCLSTVSLLSVSAVNAQTIKAADGRKAIPILLLCRTWVKNSNNKRTASWRLKSFPAAFWAMKNR
jgi:hypothetical protein